jgi:hypothetical protein
MGAESHDCTKAPKTDGREKQCAADKMRRDVGGLAQRQNGDEPLTPGKPKLFTLPDGRSFSVYVPPGLDLKKPYGVIFAADGVVSKAKNIPERQMGLINGLYAEADRDALAAKDGNGTPHIVVTLHPVQHWESRLVGTFFGWNVDANGLPYNPHGPNEKQYTENVMQKLRETFPGINLTGATCEGLSEGGAYCYAMDSQKVGAADRPFFHNIAMFSSGITPETPLIKPGVNMLVETSVNMGVLPDGGLDSSRAGWLAWLSDSRLVGIGSHLYKVAPNLVAKQWMKVNGVSEWDLSDPKKTKDFHFTSYDKTVVTSPNGATLTLVHIFDPRYGGHNMPGPNPDVKNPPKPGDGSNRMPQGTMSASHMAACLANAAGGTDCTKDGVPNKNK